MKKQTLLLFVMTCVVISSCRHFDRGNISISFSDSDRYYSMKARFDNDRMRQVEHYMDDKIGNESNMSFVNSRIDGQIALDDHTNFYIKKNRGYLLIKLDKEQNSEDSYKKVQNMCQGIKELLAGK